MTTDPILEALQKVEARLADHIDASLGQFRLEMNGRFDAIETQLDRLETEYQMIVAGLRRIEERLATQADDHGRLKAEVAGLKARLLDLEDRIRELEARLET